VLVLVLVIVIVIDFSFDLAEPRSIPPAAPLSSPPPAR
jgi:hypothetical protein